MMRGKTSRTWIKTVCNIRQPLSVSESLPAGSTHSTPGNDKNLPLGPTLWLKGSPPKKKTKCCFCILQRGKEKTSPFDEMSLNVEKDYEEEQK